jgi:hypothetical protein
MYGKSSLFGLASLFALALPSVNGYATTGCYAAGAISEILGSSLTRQQTGIATPAACAVSANFTIESIALIVRPHAMGSVEITDTLMASTVYATVPKRSLCLALLLLLLELLLVETAPRSAHREIFR